MKYIEIPIRYFLPDVYSEIIGYYDMAGEMVIFPVFEGPTIEINMDEKPVKKVAKNKESKGKKVAKNKVTKDEQLFGMLANTKTVIDFFNTTTGSDFKATTKSTQQAIHARMEEGYTIEDIKEVINVKSADPYFVTNPRYLCPSTLFRPSNFEKYLNEARAAKGLTNDTHFNTDVETASISDESF